MKVFAVYNELSGCPGGAGLFRVVSIFPDDRIGSFSCPPIGACLHIATGVGKLVCPNGGLGRPFLTRYWHKGPISPL